MALITIQQIRKVNWQEYSNSKIDGATAATFDHIVTYYESQYIPRIDDTIFVQGESLKVTDVIHKIDNNELTKIIVLVQEKTIKIPYYEYMKLFTHCCDSMKSDDDVTKDKSGAKYTTELPTAYADWDNDLSTLLHYRSHYKEYLPTKLTAMANKRCKLVTT